MLMEGLNKDGAILLPGKATFRKRAEKLGKRAETGRKCCN